MGASRACWAGSVCCPDPIGPDRKQRMRVRMLFCPKDRFPPFRVDVAVLFGRELSARGFSIDWVLQSEKAVKRAFRTEWAGGTAYVGRTDTGETLPARLREHILNIWHDFMILRLARA